MAIDEEEAVTRGDLLQEFDRELARITDFYRKKVGAQHTMQSQQQDIVRRALHGASQCMRELVVLA